MSIAFSPYALTIEASSRTPDATRPHASMVLASETASRTITAGALGRLARRSASWISVPIRSASQPFSMALAAISGCLPQSLSISAKRRYFAAAVAKT